MKTTKQIILGSGSPRRKELLKQIGLEFEVMTSDCEEQITSNEPVKVVQELSLQKAMSVFERLKSQDRGRNVLVIGADTVVSLQNRILGKPTSVEQAISMLNGLQGNTHQVYTSVSFVWEAADKVCSHTFYEKTAVEVLPMSEKEISDYVSLNTCMDKAGAYGIQNEFACYVRAICGDYNNVVGLPVCRLYQELKKLSFVNI